MLPTPRRTHQGKPPRRWPARLRGAAFALLYGPGARLYDRFTDRLFLGEWARWQETVLPHLPRRGLVVELGAGTGRLAAVGARPGRRWLAIEPAASMLATQRRRARGDGNWAVRARAGALPLRDGAADAVVATFPTAYILEPVAGAEVARVLAPGGRLVVVLDGALAPDGPRRRATGAALRLFYGKDRPGGAERLHLRGIEGKAMTVPTRHGTASLYVGTNGVSSARRDGAIEMDRESSR